MEITLSKCKTHKDLINRFLCKECEADVCERCLVYYHNGHEMGYLEDLLKPQIQMIEEEREKIKKLNGLYREAESNITMKEQNLKDTYQTIENDVMIHGEKLESMVRKAKGRYLRQVRKKKESDLKLMEKQKDTIKGKLEKAREMELCLPNSQSLCKIILAFRGLNIGSLPEVPKLQEASHPLFSPTDEIQLEKIIDDSFGNLAI